MSEKQRKHLEKLRILHLGRKRSKETKKNISNALKGKTLGIKRPKHSKLMKENNPKGMLNKKHSEETKKNMSKSHKGEKQSYTWRKNRSLAMSGEKHWNWQGGPKITRQIKHYIRKGLEYKIWRKAVFERDNWTCQKCGKRNLYLEAHHLKSFCDYPELRFAIDNGITLCRKCHLEIR